MTVDEFVTETLGQWYDMDGVPVGNPYQCADYFKLACQKLLGYHFPCGGDGYVDNWWNEETRKAHSKEFKYVTDWHKLKDGDFVIWGNARRYPETINPLSHIAMYYKGNMVGTNQFGHKEVTSVPVDDSVWKNMIGAYRFRSWEGAEEEVPSEDTKKYTLNGIDISNHQGSAGFDLSQVNYDFVIIKSTEGIGFVDPYCDRYVQEAIRAGKCWGFYHFGRPGNDPIKEADFWYENTKNYFHKGLPVLDIEVTDGNEDVVAWCYRFLSRIIDLTGVKPLVYMSEQSFEWKYDWSAVVSLDVGLWLAAYRSSTAVYNYDYPKMWKSPVPKSWPFITMWQYTSNGHLDGYNGRLDMDIWFGDKETWMKYVESAPHSTQPVPEAVSDDSQSISEGDDIILIDDEEEAEMNGNEVVQDITKIDWKRKLSSRKFWVAIINLLTAVFLALHMSEQEIAQITAIIMASGGLIAYILAEGWIDANREANRHDSE